MKGWMQNIYWALPGPARSLAAGVRGRYLNSLRYDRDTDRLVEMALAREQWSAPQWQAWQDERLAFILRRAATRVPFYREAWSSRRRRGDESSWEHLENWPLLEKDSLRAQAQSFVADDVDARRMYHDHTSGTSGKPLDIWQTHGTVRAWYALFEARWRRWYGVSRHDRWANIGGQLVTPQRQRKPPFWIWNPALNQLYMSSYHLAPDLIPSYLDALRRYRITYLLGYTSSLHALAREVLRLNRKDVPMAVVITNAEPLLEHERQVIAEAFQCPVRATYGMTEMVTAAGECNAGRLHLWPEVGVVEVQDRGQTAAPGTLGDLVCTGLFNADMPLIRYNVGDRASLSGAADECSCGRGLPVLRCVEGRSDDTLFTGDGRRIGRLDTVFKDRLPIREAQIIQESLQRIRVKYVSAPGFTPEAGNSIVSRLKARLGDIEVVLEEVDRIPRSANGKFRGVVCMLPAEEQRRLAEGAIAETGGS